MKAALDMATVHHAAPPAALNTFRILCRMPTLSPLTTMAFDTAWLRRAKSLFELSRRHEATAAYIRGATPPAYRPRS